MITSLEALIADTKDAIARRKDMPGFGPDTSIARLNIINATRHAFSLENVEALVAALEQSKQEKQKWFDWSKQLGELADAKDKRIAELESLCVNPDAAMREVGSLCVKLPGAYTVRPGHPFYGDEQSVMIPKEGGNWLSRFDVEHVLHVAGVQVEGGE